MSSFHFAYLLSIVKRSIGRCIRIISSKKLRCLKWCDKILNERQKTNGEENEKAKRLFHFIQTKCKWKENRQHKKLTVTVTEWKCTIKRASTWIYGFYLFNLRIFMQYFVVAGFLNEFFVITYIEYGSWMHLQIQIRTVHTNAKKMHQTEFHLYIYGDDDVPKVALVKRQKYTNETNEKTKNE